jgi:hypothetical protein
MQEKGEDDTSFAFLHEDGFMKRIEWYCFKPSRVIFQHDNDPKHIAKF